MINLGSLFTEKNANSFKQEEFVDKINLFDFSIKYIYNF